MSKQNHTIDPEKLMAYLDGELPPERALETASHLEHCRECQKLSEELRQLSQTLAAWEVDDSNSMRVPVDSSGALMDRKTERKKAELWRRLLNLHLWPKKAWALAGTAVALLVLFASFGVSRLRPAQMAAPVGVASTQKHPVPPSPYIDSQSFANADNVNGKLSYYRTPQLGQGLTSDGKPQGQTAEGEGEAAGDEIKAVANGPLIVRTVDLNLTIKDFDQARSNLDEILKRHHGHIGELNVNTPSGSARSLTAVLRIPANQLDSALGDLKRLGRVEKEAQNGEEVTQQYVDLEARLKNARNTESRLIQLQRERTGKLSDVLSVEKEIGRVRGEIEQMEAERKSLRNRIDFATLNLTVIEDYKAELKVVPPSIGTQIRNAAVDGYRSVVDGLFGLLLWLLSWVPTLLIWALVLFYPARMVWRKLRMKASV